MARDDFSSRTEDQAAAYEWDNTPRDVPSAIELQWDAQHG